MKTDLFQSFGHCWVFQICWHIECSTFTASSFRISNGSTGIPSLPLALFIVMLPKAHLTSHSRMAGSRWVITPLWLSWSCTMSQTSVHSSSGNLSDLIPWIYFSLSDSHNGVIFQLEPDILECEVKWALGSITMNKASRGDGIPVELSKSWKMMLWKCCTQYASKFGKLSSGHRTGKGQFSFQSQRKAMPKNAQTTAQLHSSHTLEK